jgi:hypothetical protein
MLHQGMLRPLFWSSIISLSMCHFCPASRFNDVSYHGSEIQTPTIDRLAAEGVRLESFYT